jgi:hypothetical protein
MYDALESIQLTEPGTCIGTQIAQILIAFQIHSVRREPVKRIFFVWMLVVMLSMASFVSYASASPDESHRPPSGSGLAAPTLIAPANGATVPLGNVTWSWKPVPGAARYHLQAGRGPNLDGQYNIIDRWSLTEPSYTFNITSGFRFYFPQLYWRVRAFDANNNPGPWSEVRMFTIAK